MADSRTSFDQIGESAMLPLLRTITFAVALAPCIGHAQYRPPGYPAYAPPAYAQDDDRYFEEVQRRHEYQKEQAENWREYQKKQYENWHEYRKKQMEAWHENRKRQFERWREYHEDNEQ
jgi:hypothetical protein